MSEEKRTSSDSNPQGLLHAMLIGSAVGAFFGLLVAPESGEKTRKKLGNILDSVQDTLNDALLVSESVPASSPPRENTAPAKDTSKKSARSSIKTSTAVSETAVKKPASSDTSHEHPKSDLDKTPALPAVETGATSTSSHSRVGPQPQKRKRLSRNKKSLYKRVPRN